MVNWKDRTIMTVCDIEIMSDKLLNGEDYA
jgi:hypothetical protein